MSKPRGFTLVELLIVIALISILSTIGFVQYNNIQKKARDSKRISDIDAIVKALEINKTSAGYQPLIVPNFGGGGIPYDPRASGVTDNTKTGCGDTSSTNQKYCWYCKKAGLTTGYCTSGVDLGLEQFNSVVPSWLVCANLESGPSGANYYCRSNAQ